MGTQGRKPLPGTQVLMAGAAERVRYNPAMFRLFIVAAVVAGTSAIASAAPAKTPTGAAHRFFACAQASQCVGPQVFMGKALKEWKQIQPMLHKVQITNTALVANINDPKGAAKWRRKWSSAASEIAKSGYNLAELKKLGMGQAVVRIGPKVAIALMIIEMKMGKKERKEHLLLTMFRKSDGWRITFIEDSPSRHVRYLKRNKP